MSKQTIDPLSSFTAEMKASLREYKIIQNLYLDKWELKKEEQIKGNSNSYTHHTQNHRG